MRINNVLLNKAKRSGFLTKVEVISRQATEQEDYQVQVEDIISRKGDGEDTQFFQKNEILNHWKESYASWKSDAWAKLPRLPVTKSQILNILSGNPTIENPDSVFDFFDDFEGASLFPALVSNFGNYAKNRATYIVGDYAYVTHYQGLDIYDISDPGNPTFISNLNFGTYVLDIVVDGNYAYVSDSDEDKIYVINVSDPYNMSVAGSVTSVTYLNFAHGIAKQGDYIICCAYMSHSLTIVNVSDPANPTIQGYIVDSDKLKYIHDVAVDGNYAYVSCHGSGTASHGRVTIVNISNKSSPSIVSSISDAGLCHAADIQKKGNYCYTGTWPGQASCGGSGCYIKVIDVSDVNNPSIVGSLADSRGYILDIYGDYLYSANGEGIYTTYPFDVIDLSIPTSPTLHQRYTDISCSAMRHVKITPDGKYAILADHTEHPTTAKFYMIDLGPSKWEGNTGSASVADSIMTLTGAAAAFKNVNTLEAYEWDYPIALRTKTKFEGKGAAQGGGIAFRDALGSDYIEIWCAYNEEKTFHQPGGTIQAVTINEGAYHIYDIIRKTASTDSFYEDNVQLGTDITDGDTLGALPIAFISIGGVGYRVFSDWVLTRKYASPEPLIIKRKISGKAGIIKTICGGIAG